MGRPFGWAKNQVLVLPFGQRQASFAGWRIVCSYSARHQRDGQRERAQAAIAVFGVRRPALALDSVQRAAHSERAV
jgi:hypothetical protein